MGKVKQAAKRAHTMDRELSRQLGELRDEPVVKVIGGASELGDQPPLVVLNLATIAVGMVLRRPDVVRTGVRMLAAHALATGLKSLVKNSVDRSRPYVMLDGGEYRMEPGESHDHALSSFPSGHTAGALAVSAAIARDWPGAAPLAHGTAAAIAGMQLPRAKHYLSDIAAGAAIGLVAEWTASAVLDGAEAAVRTRLDRQQRHRRSIQGEPQDRSSASSP